MMEATSTVQTLTTNSNLIISNIKETPSRVSFLWDVNLYQIYFILIYTLYKLDTSLLKKTFQIGIGKMLH